MISELKHSELKILWCLLLLLWVQTVFCQTVWDAKDGQETKTVRPWTFWYWMYGAVSDEGIRADLQGMKDAGIAGFYLMPIKDVSDGEAYGGTARQLSEEWWKRMDTVWHVADSLGLEAGIHFSDGFALGGGPWITPEESMQRVVWSDTIIEGGRGTVTLPLPPIKEGYYKDIAVYAIPLGKEDWLDDATPTASVEFPFRSAEPCDIVYTYEKPFTLRCVQVVTGGNNYQAHRWQVSASDDGVNYRFVRTIEPARQGWQNTDAYATYAIPATTARYFKFHWTPEGSDPGSEDMDAAKWRPVLKVAALRLSSQAVIDGYEGKSGAVWRVSKSFPLADVDCVRPADIVRLTVDAKGNVSGMSQGLWRVLRMGHTSTGHTNATGGGGRGLECDKFSRQAIRKQLMHWFGAIHERAPRHVLRRLHVDSWECGSQNWSADYAEEFARRRGYDLLPWLPVLAGVPLENSAKSEQVLRDVRETIAELITDIFFDEVAQAARRYHVELSAECVAPTMVSDGLLHYQHTDYPMGEFWLNSPTHDKPNDMLDAISGAHVYGKRIIQAEGFTEVRGTWDETPARLKPLLDRNYCLGINSIVFHVNTHNPWTDRRPGMTLDGIGTFLQRDNTWWREMPAFTDYIRRTQRLLQYGQPVVELAVYTGDEVPRRALLPEILTHHLPGLMGDSLCARETERMRNKGQPMETSPVGVSHTKNMTKAEEWINPLHGYKYDTFNPDVLRGMRMKNGRIVTRDGMCYSAIVLPQMHRLNPDGVMADRNEIDRIIREGGDVITSPWKAADMSSLGLTPDVSLPSGIDYTHRQGNDADVYFFSNQTAQTVTFSPRCRASQHQYHYLYDPLTDKTYVGGDSIRLEAYGSVFSIYSDTPYSGVLSTPFVAKKSVPLTGPWHLRFEENGRELTTPTLRSWTEETDPAIAYYSGHVTYETTFRHKGKGAVWLNLGEVHNIATVYVNGINCGTVWTAPYRVDISHAVKRGKNELRISVVNTWANALQGADEGKAPFEGIWTNGKYRRAEKTLLPAGIVGTLNFER